MAVRFAHLSFAEGESVFVDLLKALKRFNVDLKRNTQKIYPPGVSFSKKEGGVFRNEKNRHPDWKKLPRLRLE